jgi:hypothetical protein
LRSAAGFDAGGEVARVVASEAGFAERAEQIAQGFEAEEVEALVGDFEFGLLRVSPTCPPTLDWREGSCGLIDEM